MKDRQRKCRKDDDEHSRWAERRRRAATLPQLEDPQQEGGRCQWNAVQECLAG